MGSIQDEVAKTCVAVMVSMLTACAAQPDRPYEQAASSTDRTHSVATIAGRDVRIAVHSHWNADCTPAGDPEIVLHARPKHGLVSFRPQTAVVTHSRFGVSCIGKTLPGIGVWYTPDQGFTGRDWFDYDIVSRQHVARDTAIIDVR
jgi:hypothetical protein